MKEVAFAQSRPCRPRRRIDAGARVEHPRIENSIADIGAPRRQRQNQQDPAGDGDPARPCKRQRPHHGDRGGIQADQMPEGYWSRSIYQPNCLRASVRTPGINLVPNRQLSEGKRHCFNFRTPGCATPVEPGHRPAVPALPTTRPGSPLFRLQTRNWENKRQRTARPSVPGPLTKVWVNSAGIFAFKAKMIVEVGTMIDTMSRAAISRDWVGSFAAEKFPLLQWLGGSQATGVFLTEFGEPSQKAVIKLVAEEDKDAAARAAAWETAATLSHPNLMKVYTQRPLRNRRPFLPLRRHRICRRSSRRDSSRAAALARRDSRNAPPGPFRALLFARQGSRPRPSQPLQHHGRRRQPQAHHVWRLSRRRGRHIQANANRLRCARDRKRRDCSRLGYLVSWRHSC